MARIVLVCADETERTLLQACLKGHDVSSVKNLKDAAKVLTQGTPEVVLTRLDTKNSTGMDVLHLMKRSQIKAPAIAVLPLRGTPLENEAWQLGVRTYLTLPIRYDDVRKAIEKVLAEAKRASQNSDVPPITDYEQSQNLTFLVEKLNQEMKCPAGANRILIRSVIMGLNNKSQPRVCLRCPIRQAVGLNHYVYYEHIRDYCTGNPKLCDGVIQYKKLRKANG